MLHTTAMFAGPLGLLYLSLTWRVIGFRRSLKIGIGDGGNQELKRAIRAHANAGETIPIGLLLLALSEAGGAPWWVVVTLGGMLLAGRVLHAVGLSRHAGTSPGRFVGMVLTLGVLGLGSLSALATGAGLWSSADLKPVVAEPAAAE